MKNVLQLIILFSFIHASTLAQSSETIYRHTATPNPTGLQLGFWEVYNQQPNTLELTGKRPTSRVGFDNWLSFETSKGVYNFSSFNNYSRVHNYGATILAAVNISFTNLITANKQTIPSFYVNDITNTETRQAAKNFLKAYVQALLKTVGTLVLTIDYEIVSNYKLSLPNSDSRATAWGAWYVEAAAVARQAAADIGMADKLKLMPIVNGNPLDTENPISKGAAKNQWLVNVVNASDYLALDTYHGDSTLANTSAKSTFDIIKFWIDNYAGNKEVIVTENGFNTVTQINPAITRVNRSYKLTGTEADQAIYYQNLFAQLGEANKTNGIFRNKLRSFNIWAIRDNHVKDVSDEERYFGLIGIDSKNNDYLKPAANIVKNGYAALETDAFHRPYNVNNGENITSSGILIGNGNLSLNYNNGDSFDFLRYTITNLGQSSKYTLNVSTVDTGNIILKVNNKWLYYEANKTFTLDVTPYCLPKALNTIDLYCTSGKFPFTQKVKLLKLNPVTTSIEDISDLGFTLNNPYPNPSAGKNVAISFQSQYNDLVEIDIINTQGETITHLYKGQPQLNQLQTVYWNTQTIANGIYYIKMVQNNKQSVKKIIVSQ